MVSEQIGSGVDREVLLDRVGGDEDLLREITKIFLDEYPSLVDDIKSSLDKSDAKGLEHAAHSLKGSVANFGAKAATAAAYRLEFLGRSKDLGGAPAAFAELIQEFQLLRPQLHDLIS